MPFELHKKEAKQWPSVDSAWVDERGNYLTAWEAQQHYANGEKVIHVPPTAPLAREHEARRKEQQRLHTEENQRVAREEYEKYRQQRNDNYRKVINREAAKWPKERKTHFSHWFTRAVRSPKE